MAAEDTLNGILTTVANTLSAVTGIGRVHTYVRWAMTSADFEAMAVTGGVINAWQVYRKSTEERWLTTGEVWRAHLLAIEGAYGVADAQESERTFQGLIERAAKRFRTWPMVSLNDTVESIFPGFGPMSSSSVLLGARGGLQVENVEHREWNSKLVHWAQLQLGVQELPSRLTD